jgi:glycosyl transferase family 8
MSRADRIAIVFVYVSPRHRIPHRPLYLWAYRRLYGLYRRLRNRGGERSRTYDYMPGLLAAVTALRRRCRNVPQVLVISPDDPGPIAGVDRVVRLDPEPFQSIRRVIFEFGLGVYLKLALFALKGFDRIVYFDLDTLIVDDVSELWDPNRYAEKDLYAVREEARYGGRSPMIGHLNSGVMILNRAMLDGRMFQTALSLARAGRSLDAGDQGVINALLSDASHGLAVGELDPMLNVMVNDITLESGMLSELPARILHFTGNFKPWSQGVESGVPYGPAMRRLWLEHTGASSQGIEGPALALPRIAGSADAPNPSPSTNASSRSRMRKRPRRSV